MPARARRAVRLVAAAACAGALLAGCAGGGRPSPSPTTPAPTSASPTPGPTQGSTVPPEPAAVADAAVADLANRLGGGTEPITVVLAQRETFPDGALGCPQPGHMYTQALVDGYRVVLARGDREWLYTAGTDGIPHLCPSGEQDGGTPSGAPLTPSAG
ncbi:hypothetical protein [Georgenia ruanii]|uniref:hypothetical protein n=1 Tax=Georgenia ruanii TaxID=348442 RepID=UPI0012641B92|nr:hypothetical protein [Georgenia ruanii]